MNKSEVKTVVIGAMTFFVGMVAYDYYKNNVAKNAGA